MMMERLNFRYEKKSEKTQRLDLIFDHKRAKTSNAYIGDFREAVDVSMPPTFETISLLGFDLVSLNMIVLCLSRIGHVSVVCWHVYSLFNSICAMLVKNVSTYSSRSPQG